jgi:Rieske Fe-S protein
MHVFMCFKSVMTWPWNERILLRRRLRFAGYHSSGPGVIESCNKPSFVGPTNVNLTLDLTNSVNAHLISVDGSIIANGVIVIRTGISIFDALSATCTHAGCTVGWVQFRRNCFPCHGGTYSPAAGAVIGGPPPSALTKFTIKS